MVMKLKESESKLEQMLVDCKPENDEVPVEEAGGVTIVELQASDVSQGNKSEPLADNNFNIDKTCNVKHVDSSIINNNLKKVTNIENEQLNKSMHSIKVDDEAHLQGECNKITDIGCREVITQLPIGNLEQLEIDNAREDDQHSDPKKDDQELNDMLRKNILSCVEKITRIEEMKSKKKEMKKLADQVFVC